MRSIQSFHFINVMTDSLLEFLFVGNVHLDVFLRSRLGPDLGMMNHQRYVVSLGVWVDLLVPLSRRELLWNWLVNYRLHNEWGSLFVLDVLGSDHRVPNTRLDGGLHWLLEELGVIFVDNDFLLRGNFSKGLSGEAGLGDIFGFLRDSLGVDVRGPNIAEWLTLNKGSSVSLDVVRHCWNINYFWV